jgi:hypothetical protein
MLYGKKTTAKTMSKPSPTKMKPAPKSKSAGLIPLPMKKGSPKPKKVNLPGKKTKPSPMINY